MLLQVMLQSRPTLLQAGLLTLLIMQQTHVLLCDGDVVYLAKVAPSTNMYTRSQISTYAGSVG